MYNFDTNIIASVLDGMKVEQRREWMVKILMAERGLTFDGIAKRHRITKEGLCAPIRGERTWTPRIVAILEKEFGIDFTPFLNEKETKKMGR